MTQIEIRKELINESALRLSIELEFTNETGLEVEFIQRVATGWILKDTNGTLHKITE